MAARNRLSNRGTGLFHGGIRDEAARKLGIMGGLLSVVQAEDEFRRPKSGGLKRVVL